MISTSISRWLPSGEQFLLLKDYLVSELRTQIGRCQVPYSSSLAVFPHLNLCFDYLTSKMTQLLKFLAVVVTVLPRVLSTPVLQPTPPMGEFISSILSSF
jgi:hypothetical protein